MEDKDKVLTAHPGLTYYIYVGKKREEGDKFFIS